MADQDISDAHKAEIAAMNKRYLEEKGYAGTYNVYLKRCQPPHMRDPLDTDPDTIAINLRVGSKVRQYVLSRKVWQDFINLHAQQVMSDHELLASKSVRGIIERTKSILSMALRHIEIPADVIESLMKDITLCEEVSEEYLKEETATDAAAESPLAINNRQHKFFRQVQSEVLKRLQAYAFMTS